MALELPANLARRLIGDPVMAAKAIMGAEMDVFQAGRLRMMWFTPVVLDHSGISTAKSETVFLLSMLRGILLPNPKHYVGRVGAVYYQGLSAAEETYLPKIAKYCEKSRIFESQIKVQRGGALWKSLKGCFVIELRNGSRIELPAGDFARDSKNQASKRVNDVYLDETGEMDKMGDGINKQILGRATLECFNPNHPVWGNHQVFLGHAESPEHPYYKRYSAIRRKAKRGSQRNATFVANYRDYSGRFLERYGQEALQAAENAKDGVLDESEFAWQWLGLWKRSTMGFYSGTLRDGIMRIDLLPQLRRELPEAMYFLGWDTAGGMKAGGDFNAGTVVCAQPKARGPEPHERQEGYLLENGQWWFIHPVYAVFLFSKNVDQLSGVIHKLHQAFRFTGITLDSQGGGVFVYKKLVESRQFIDNVWTTLPGGLCMPQDQYEWIMAEAIVSMFDRGDPLFRELFGEKYLQDNSGPIDFSHRFMKTLMGRGSIAWPADKEERAKHATLDVMTVEQHKVLEDLSKALRQFGGIGLKVDKEKRPVYSQKGFQQYANSGKKDGAMSAIYATLRAIIEIRKRKAVAASTAPVGFYP